MRSSGRRVTAAAEERRRARAERAVAVEQAGAVEAGAGGHLGDGGLGGRRLQAPAPTAVDERQRRDGAHGGDDRRAALGDLRDRRALHRAQPGAHQRVRRPVADAGDVALVAHHAGELEARPRDDRAGECRRVVRRPQRRALRSDPHPPASELEARVEVQADAHRARPARRRRGGIDQVQVVGAVDHQHRRRRDVERAELCQRRALRGRVAEQQVVEPVLVQPQRLAQRERHEPEEAGTALRLAQQRPAAHRLARHPDRLARRAAHEVGRVGPERVQVDDRERRLDIPERGLQALVRRVSGHRPILVVARAPSRDGRGC